jgi:hypothetical protein
MMRARPNPAPAAGFARPYAAFAPSRSGVRRAVTVVLASILLHVFLLDWADGSVVAFRRERQKPGLIEAQLRPIQPKAAPLEPAQPPVAAIPPRKLVKPPKPVAPAPVESPPAPVTAPPTAAAAAPVLASTTPAAAAPVASITPRYQVSLPPSAQLSYKVTRQEPKLDAPFYGKSSMSWSAGEGKYSMRTEAGLSVPFTTLNIFTLTSEGDINNAGIAPRITTETRRGRSETATHFNREKGTITFSANTASVPLTEGAQDQATIAMQLAGIGRANAGQFKTDSEFEILVGESREATLFRFVVAGQEELETELGRFSTWHVVRPARPGSYSSRLDLWFAPALDWYPVQIRNSEANGAITTQSVSEILTAGAASPAR